MFSSVILAFDDTESSRWSLDRICAKVEREIKNTRKTTVSKRDWPYQKNSTIHHLFKRFKAAKAEVV